MPQVDLSWLHLTDLHVGMGSQKWLWPSVKHAVIADIEKLASKTKGIDLVIFSGDLVQSGKKEEFDKLDEILGELWEKFTSIGSNPKLFHIPGNHDLARPAPRDPDFLNIARWWDDNEVQQEFWRNSFKYQDKLIKLFSAYNDWSNKLVTEKNLIVAGGKRGLLPGDQSIVFEKGGARVGLIGLNSTWLQFAEGDLRGKLSVELRQLHALTNDDPKSWCDANDANILVTHQSIGWLHPSIISTWDSEINPPGRFDVHLYGHMHEAEASSVSTFGSTHRTSIQGPSLFGLEYLADGQTNRIHGHSLCQLRDDQGRRTLKMWPRTFNRAGSGTYKIIPDYKFELEQEAITASDRQIVNSQMSAPSKTVHIAQEENSSPETEAVADKALSALKYHLSHDTAHDFVRKLDQHRAKRALEHDRVCWVVSEWGMGADEFIASLLERDERTNTPIFKLGISGFIDQEQLSSSLRELYGFSVDRMIDQLAEIGRSYLILDEVDAGKLPKPGELNTEEKLERLCDIALEYCTDLRIIIRSRSTPIRIRRSLVQLREFDAVDLRGYVIAKKGEFSELCSVNSLQTLLRHTDGVPVRLDAALEALEVIPLPELINSNTDLVSEALTSDSGEEAAALTSVLTELKNTTNHTSQRSFELLKVLSIFPRGEQLSRIARFRGAHAFYPQNASELLKLSLIEASTTHLVGLGQPNATSKILLAPRLVRERVREFLLAEEYQAMNRRAAELYFGSEWESGSYKPPPSYRFDNAHCGSSEIHNANAIAIRVLKDARDFGDERAIGAALGLSIAYTKALIRGDHFGSASIFLEDYFSLITDFGFEQKLRQLKALRAQAVRMIGENERARDILVDLDIEDFDSVGKQSALLDLLLCYEKLGDHVKSKRIGEQILAIDRNTSRAWQAKSVLLRMQPDSPERTRKLRTLEGFCRKHNAHTVADEIALTLASESKGDTLEKIRILEPVISNTSNKTGFYTRLRAGLQVAQISIKENGRLEQTEQAGMVVAYHYLFSESLSGMFNRCHDILWRDFVAKGDIQNMISLFRHSSLSWRLQGRDDLEISYLRKAERLVAQNRSAQKIAGTRELAYYESRAKALLS